MIAKGNFTLEKNREMKSIIRRLFFCDSRAGSALFRALSSFPACDSFEGLFNVYTFLESGGVFFHVSWWLRLEFPSAINSIMIRNCYNTEAVENNSKTWMTIIRMLGGTETIWHFCCVEMLPGSSGNETVYSANIQCISVSEKQCLLWHKKLMRGLNEVNSPQHVC